MKPKPVRLPEAEWKFELAEIETPYAFFYEYGRDSETVKAEVAKMRTERKGRVWHYCPRKHPFFEVIAWLADLPSFPSIPWLTLPGKGIDRLLFLPRTGCHTIPLLPPVNLRPGIGFKHVWGGDEQSSREMLSNRAQTFVPATTDAIVLNPEASYFEFGVNWLLSNKEITEMVANIIEESRPEQFRAFAKTPMFDQGSFGSADLPFRKRAALHWLGVLRRRTAVATWPEYFACYPKKTYNNRSGSFERGAERGPQEDRSKAKLILDLFDSGIPLKKKDFV